MDRQELRDLNALREYNQNLLNLLKKKQSLVKGALPHDITKTVSQRYDSNGMLKNPMITDTHENIQDFGTELIGVSKPIRSENARKKLSSLNRGNRDHNNSTDHSQDDYDKFSKYRETDESMYVGKGMSRKSIAQGIAEDDCTHGNDDSFGPRDRRYNDFRYDDSFDRKMSSLMSDHEERLKQAEELNQLSDLVNEKFDRDLEKELEEAKQILEEVRLSTESEKTRTSTPMGTPQRSLTPQMTPKSILKRRQIIDDNVQVESKFPHTPTNRPTPKKKSLNYSYSNVDDLEMAESKRRYSVDTDGSFIDETDLNPRTSIRQSETKKDSKKQELKRNTISDEVDRLVQSHRLLDSGNDRQNAAIIRELDSRPRAVVFDLEAPEPNSTTHSVTMQSQSQSTKSTMPDTTQSSYTKSSTHIKAQQPLLGYDWIAGVLDNQGHSIDQPDEYFQELNEFRKVNKHDCMGNELHFNRSLARPISPEIEDPKHTCIHGYSLNDRLFTEPMNINEDGVSVCPVCLIDRKPPTQLEPGFVRVSIPRSTIASPYRVVPHRRRSFDPSDSYALGNHCLAGWQNAQPSAIPTASTVDLKQGHKEKEILSYQDVQKMASKLSKLGRLIDTTPAVSLIDDSTSGKKATKDLLNTTHSLRAELQTLEKIRGLDWSAGPNSTNYPML